MKDYLKRNKALLILPLGLLPFVVLIFYVLGGGENAKGNKAGSTREKVGQTGANYQLPGADRTIKIHDKMEAWEQEKSQAVSTHDYNIMGGKDTTGQPEMVSLFPGDSVAGRDPENAGEANTDLSNNLLAHIKAREQQVRNELEDQPSDKKNEDAKPYAGNPKHSKAQTPTNRKSKPAGGYHETNNLVMPSKTGFAELDQVFDQNRQLNQANDSLRLNLQQANQKLQTLEKKQKQSFKLKKSRLGGFNADTASVDNPIKAEVYETTTVLSGNRVQLRLLESCSLAGRTIPANTFFYGICKINNERLEIHVSCLPQDGRLLPVQLNAYDLDGLEGLYVPGNAARRISKDVGGSMNTSSLIGTSSNPLTSVGVRVAGRTAQQLIKSVRQKKVTIKANTLVYLINQK